VKCVRPRNLAVVGTLYIWMHRSCSLKRRARTTQGCSEDRRRITLAVEKDWREIEMASSHRSGYLKYWVKQQLKHMENSRIDICHCMLASFRFNYQSRNLSELQRTIENLQLFSSLSFLTLAKRRRCQPTSYHSNSRCTSTSRPFSFVEWLVLDRCHYNSVTAT
jgi:hypothetical protein